MEKGDKIKIFFAFALIVACLACIMYQKEAEKQAYEKMCKAYDDGNYNMAQEYLEQVESIEEYSRGEEIQNTLEVWGQLGKIHEKIMNIKPGIFKKNDFSDYSHLYEEDIDPDTRDRLVEYYRWSGEGEWTVSDYDDLYKEVEDYEEENLAIKNVKLQREFDNLKKEIKGKKEDHILQLSQISPFEGMKEEEIEYTSWGKPNEIVRSEDSSLKWEEQRRDRQHRIYIWYEKNIDGDKVPEREVWTHYSPDGEGFVLSVEEKS